MTRIPFYVYWFIKKGEKHMANLMRKMYTSDQIKKLGGTKLYKHDIYMYVEDSPETQVCFLSTRKEPFDIHHLDDLLNEFVGFYNQPFTWKVSNADDGYTGILISFYRNGTYLEFTIIEINTITVETFKIQEQDLELHGDFEDIVTPL